MWSLGVLQQQPPKSWLREYLTHLRPARVKQMCSESISELLWGMCVLRHVPGVWQTGEITAELMVGRVTKAFSAVLNVLFGE